MKTDRRAVTTRTRLRFFTVLSLSVLQAVPLICRTALADEANIAPALETLHLSTSEYLDIVLTENDALRQQKLEEMINVESIKRSTAAFDPVLRLDFEKSYGYEQNNTEESLTRQLEDNYEYEDKSYSAAISGKLPFGTEYRVFYDLSDPSNSLQANEAYGKEFKVETGLEITQPLLKNFGISANMAAVTIAKANHRISAEDLRAIRMSTAYQAAVNYAFLQLAQEKLALGQAILEQENKRVAQMEALVTEGRITQAQYLFARSSLLTRQSQINAYARQQRRAISETRRMLIGAGNTELVGVVATDALPKPLDAVRQDVATIAEQLKQRPEMTRAQLEVEQAQTRLSFARNQALPDLSLHLKGGRSGLGSDFSRANDRLDDEYDFWLIGTTFTMPLYGMERRATVAAAELRYRQATESLRSLETLLLDEVLAGYDDVENSYREANEYLSAVNAMEEADSENRRRQAEGKISNMELIGSRLQLLEARTLLSEKQFENRRARIKLALADGSILEFFGMAADQEFLLDTETTAQQQESEQNSKGSTL